MGWRRRVMGLVSRTDIGLVMNDALLDLDSSISSWIGACSSDEKAFLDTSELEAEVLDRSTCACLSEAPEHCYQHLPISREVSLEDLVMPNPKRHQRRNRDFEIIPSIQRMLSFESDKLLPPLSKHHTGRSEDDWTEVEWEDTTVNLRPSHAEIVRKAT
ncbi:hypothetical protein SISSUDRAFT_397112 [Sistotremastrum suecicum HHB10207 ss-3]|uniref:Uncharacterized protein n=1 Tax=Sistotremastrum suecicum HHB10207 ss-3 TaxID=1314776 RepID=A0A165YTI7_9AGAM|nr:hypothetical protein SISSUDRAFT_397112 [Sistotremastrum suecicum HHB10207 ss-3]